MSSPGRTRRPSTPSVLAPPSSSSCAGRTPGPGSSSTTPRCPPADSDIFLDDVTVSRKHAVFTRDGDTFAVRDVGSLNGTYLNRERIDAAVLHTGDEVQIGKFRLVFYAGRPES